MLSDFLTLWFAPAALRIVVRENQSPHTSKRPDQRNGTKARRPARRLQMDEMRCAWPNDVYSLDESERRERRRRPVAAAAAAASWSDDEMTTWVEDFKWGQCCCAIWYVSGSALAWCHRQTRATIRRRRRLYDVSCLLDSAARYTQSSSISTRDSMVNGGDLVAFKTCVDNTRV